VTELTASEIVYQAFADAWAASAYSALPYGRDGVAFDPTTTHAVISVRHAKTTQDTMGSTGNRRIERIAVFLAVCAAPAGLGRAGASAVKEVAIAAFEGKQLSSAVPGDVVTCEVADVSEVGSDGTWYRFLVSVPFRYYYQR
jgi:hypothetical protein